MGVAVTPGATTFTRMPAGASSQAASLVSAMTAVLLLVYPVHEQVDGQVHMRAVASATTMLALKLTQGILCPLCGWRPKPCCARCAVNSPMDAARHHNPPTQAGSSGLAGRSHDANPGNGSRVDDAAVGAGRLHGACRMLGSHQHSPQVYLKRAVELTGVHGLNGACGWRRLIGGRGRSRVSSADHGRIETRLAGNATQHALQQCHAAARTQDANHTRIVAHDIDVAIVLHKEGAHQAKVAHREGWCHMCGCPCGSPPTL